MKFSIALATVFLVATTALPALAATPAPHHSVQYQHGYRNGAAAFAASPRPERQVAPAGWGHCISNTVEAGARSAYPSWDICSSN